LLALGAGGRREAASTSSRSRCGKPSETCSRRTRQVQLPDSFERVFIRASLPSSSRSWSGTMASRAGEVIAARTIAQAKRSSLDSARGWVDRDILTFMTDWALWAVGGLDPGG
jgi:hypothetical protein